MTFKDLKVGDKVFVVTAYFTHLKQVEKITPTGLIKVGGQLYNQDGNLHNRDIWTRNRLEIATEKKIEEHLKESLIEDCIMLLNRAEKLTYSQVKRVKEILDESEVK